MHGVVFWSAAFPIWGWWKWGIMLLRSLAPLSFLHFYFNLLTSPFSPLVPLPSVPFLLFPTSLPIMVVVNPVCWVVIVVVTFGFCLSLFFFFHFILCWLERLQVNHLSFNGCRLLSSLVWVKSLLFSSSVFFCIWLRKLVLTYSFLIGCCVMFLRIISSYCCLGLSFITYVLFIFGHDLCCAVVNHSSFYFYCIWQHSGELRPY